MNKYSIKILFLQVNITNKEHFDFKIEKSKPLPSASQRSIVYTVQLQNSKMSNSPLLFLICRYFQYFNWILRA